MLSKTPPQTPIDSTTSNTDRVADIERSIAAHLLERFGPMLNLAEVAEVLEYRSSAALERSIERGHVELPMLNLPHRRGTFMLAHDLARHLAFLGQQTNSQTGQSAELRKERECR